MAASVLDSFHCRGAMLGLCSASALLQTLCFRSTFVFYGKPMSPQDTCASSSGWAALLVDEFPRWGFPVLLLSRPVCWAASSRISFFYLVVISGWNPSGWWFSPGPCTTNLAVMFLYSHHWGLPLNLPLSLHLSLLCLIASGQRCIFCTLVPMLRKNARCLASAL